MVQRERPIVHQRVYPGPAALAAPCWLGEPPILAPAWGGSGPCPGSGGPWGPFGPCAPGKGAAPCRRWTPDGMGAWSPWQPLSRAAGEEA